MSLHWNIKDPFDEIQNSFFNANFETEFDFAVEKIISFEENRKKSLPKTIGCNFSFINLEDRRRINSSILYYKIYLYEKIKTDRNIFDRLHRRWTNAIFFCNYFLNNSIVDENLNDITSLEEKKDIAEIQFYENVCALIDCIGESVVKMCAFLCGIIFLAKCATVGDFDALLNSHEAINSMLDTPAGIFAQQKISNAAEWLTSLIGNFANTIIEILCGVIGVKITYQ